MRAGLGLKAGQITRASRKSKLDLCYFGFDADFDKSEPEFKTHRDLKVSGLLA